MSLNEVASLLSNVQNGDGNIRKPAEVKTSSKMSSNHKQSTRAPLDDTVASFGSTIGHAGFFSLPPANCGLALG